MRTIDTKYHVEGDRIVKTSNGQEIPVDEPTFLFRGRDRLARAALLAYREICIQDGCLPEHLESLDGMIERFERFAADNPERMKQPGSTRGR